MDKNSLPNRTDLRNPSTGDTSGCESSNLGRFLNAVAKNPKSNHQV